MSSQNFHMDVRVEKVLEEGVYDAVLQQIEQKESKKDGSRFLLWTFAIQDEAVEIVGFSSMSPSTRGKAYQWASTLMGGIDPKVGWGPRDVIGKPCRVTLITKEDDQGFEENRVDRVMKLKSRPQLVEDDEDQMEDVPF